MAVNTIGAGVILNEGSIDVDFRVESNGNANMLFVDGGNDRVGIGEASPTDPLHVKTTAVETRISLESSTGKWAIGAEDNDKFGILNYGTSTPFIIDSTGKIGIGTTSPGAILDVDSGATGESDSEACGIRVTLQRNGSAQGLTLRHEDASGGSTDDGEGTSIQFQGYDGSNSYHNLAGIFGRADGESVSDSDSPGFLTFHTTANGSDSLSERMRINSTGFVGIGTNAQQKMLHIERGDTDCMIILDSSNSASDKQICFAEDYVTGNETGGDYWGVGVDASEGPDFVIAFDANAQASMGGDDDKLRIKTTGLVVINQGANDGSILEFKSSDVAHGMTDNYETDTYAAFSKSSATNGGFRLEGYSESKEAILLDGISSTDNTTKSTSAQGNVMIRAWKKSSNSWSTIEADGNLLTVGNGNAVRFIFDEDGDFHYDSSAAAYDSYNDAQLVRAFDSTMSPKNIIQSKWDEFVTYKEKDLVEANLLGKVSNEEKAEGVKPLVNLTGMSRLHNGAIWQQYTEMQKMKELMYDAMVELMGKEKADKKLKNHDVNLIDNKDLLN